MNKEIIKTKKGYGMLMKWMNSHEA